MGCPKLHKGFVGLYGIIALGGAGNMAWGQLVLVR